LWGEFQYEEANRRKVAGQLRLAVDHLKYDHTDLALRCRNVAMRIEYAQDASKRDIQDTLADLLNAVLPLFYADNPEVKKRLDALPTLS
jgi:hypothetical protein